jgi:ATP-dependent protease HslVU (ClpYQ) ATPase subunit
LCAPSTALEVIESVAVIFVAELNVHAVTVSPSSESKSQEGLARKFVPLITTLMLDCPGVPVFGETLLMVGAGLPPVCTVKALFSVELCPSVFVTVTLRDPVVALDCTLITAVSDVEEL